MSIADFVRAPIDDGNGDFGAREFTVTSTSAANPLPEEWFRDSTRYLTLTSTVDARVGFSKESDAEINHNVTATEAGAFALVGAVLLAGVQRHFALSQLGQGQEWYFVREAASSGVITVELTSS